MTLTLTSAMRTSGDRGWAFVARATTYPEGAVPFRSAADCPRDDGEPSEERVLLERGLRALGFEAISAFVDRAARKGEELWRSLTRRHKRRRPRRARPSRDMIKDRASIHDRPRDVEGRAAMGHWEGDLIICKRTRPVLVPPQARAPRARP